MRLALLLALGLAAGPLAGQEAVRSEPIDLPTALRLAGAQSLDVQLAEARWREAQASADSTAWALFPTISPGIGYRKHSGQLQDIVGQVLDVNKESLSTGATLGVSLELGEAVYRRLAAKQVALAAGHQFEAQRRQTVLAAAAAYFDLSRSHQTVALLEDAVKTAREYHAQLAKGVGAGVAFKGDELRAAGQTNRLELRLRQALDQRRGDAARLAQTLRLDIAESLRPADDRPLALTLTKTDAKLDDQVRLAISRRPELQAAGALQEAATQQSNAADYAPLYPTLGAQVFAGGLGGSTGSATRDFDNSADTFVTLSWKIGAGGLFDGSRSDGAKARLKQSLLGEARTRDEIIRQVVEAQASTHYLSQQLKIAEEGVKTAEAGYKLALGRKELAVGVVLETLQSQQDLIQARLDYALTVGEWNKAQYRLKFAVGE